MVEVLSPEKEGRRSVRESWLQAYGHGNILMPLRYGGMVLFVSLAVLKDPPQNLLEFTTSTLSPEQLEQLSMTALHVHKVKNLEITTTNEDFIHQWREVRDIVSMRLRSLLSEDELDSLGSPDSVLKEKLINLSLAIEKIIDIFKKNQEVKRLVVQQHQDYADDYTTGVLSLGVINDKTRIIYGKVKEVLRDNPPDNVDKELMDSVVDRFLTFAN